eukprot:UN00588
MYLCDLYVMLGIMVYAVNRHHQCTQCFICSVFNQQFYNICVYCHKQPLNLKIQCAYRYQ